LPLPILEAVSDCMLPVWVDKGLAFIEAMDKVDLLTLQAAVADLGLADQFTLALRRRIEQILGPPVAAKPKPKPRPKAARPSCVSQRAWSEYTAFRERLERPKERIAV
jgi:hypothetical protein